MLLSLATISRNIARYPDKAETYAAIAQMERQMDQIDLINRIVPHAENVTVIKQDGILYLVDASRTPKEADTVLLPDGKLKPYEKSMNGTARGVAYAAIRFLLVAVFCIA